MFQLAWYLQLGQMGAGKILSKAIAYTLYKHSPMSGITLNNKKNLSKQDSSPKRIL